jgi:hypothetical protein
MALMLKRNSIPTLLILIACLTLFTLGIGASLWEKLEVINIGIYAVIWGLLLTGVSYLGYECLRILRAYRRATEKRFEDAGQVSRMVPLPSLPKPELLDVTYETLEDAYVLFYTVEDKVETESTSTRR